jgi:hypothetical protein
VQAKRVRSIRGERSANTHTGGSRANNYIFKGDIADTGLAPQVLAHGEGFSCRLAHGVTPLERFLNR